MNLIFANFFSSTILFALEQAVIPSNQTFNLFFCPFFSIYAPEIYELFAIFISLLQIRTSQD